MTGGASVVGAGGSTNQAKADSAYLRLIRRLYDAGVPLVAGTDVADLAKVETVIRGGRLYRVSDLTTAVGRPEP